MVERVVVGAAEIVENEAVTVHLAQFSGKPSGTCLRARVSSCCDEAALKRVHKEGVEIVDDSLSLEERSRSRSRFDRVAAATVRSSAWPDVSGTVDRPVGRDRAVLRRVETHDVTSVVETEG